MYIVTVRFQVKKGEMSSFMPAMLKQAQDSLGNEQNCTHFDVAISEDDANLVFLYEIYNSKVDFEYHLTTEHFISFAEKVAPWVVDKRVEAFQLQT